MAEIVEIKIQIKETDDLPEYALDVRLIKKSVLQVVLADILDRLNRDDLGVGIETYPIDGPTNEEDPLN